MDNLNWCFKQSRGIKIIEPNSEIAKKYLEEARRDFSLINIKDSKWSLIKEYYVCYNAFYSLLIRCGIKCEIHDCTIKLISLFGFDSKYQKSLEELKNQRIGVQYYLRKVNKNYFNFAKEFLDLCEVKFLELNSIEIKEIRNKIGVYLNPRLGSMKLGSKNEKS